METMQMTEYTIEEKITGYVFATAMSVEFLKEGRTEYTINGKPVDMDEFTEWLRGYYEMPHEVTSIKCWQA